MTILAALRDKFEQLTSQSEKKRLQFSYAGAVGAASSKNKTNVQVASRLATAEQYAKAADPKQTPYSHGLEAIYALETIDPKTIRPLQKKAAVKKKSPSIFIEESQESQLFFDFKDGWNEKIFSFALLEPIDVLQLPNRPMQLLKENGKQFLGDLLDTEFDSLVYIKGIGQGHIDEINQKLQDYLVDKKIPFCRHIDLSSWVRSLLAGCNSKKCAALLARYDLGHLAIMSSSEEGELRSVAKEKKRCWEEEASVELLNKCTEKFFEQLEHVTTCLFNPWILRRGGVVSEEEILERFYMLIGNDENLLDPVLAFFSDLFCYGRNPLTEKLIKVSEKQFSASKIIAQNFETITLRADSYFPNPTTSYAFDSLCELLCKEFALSWHSYPISFIREALKRSARFLVYKDRQYGLVIRSR